MSITLFRWLDPTTRSTPAACRRSFRPRLEALEDRAVPAVFTVTNLADSGGGSLRQAILDANAGSGNQTIQFADGLNGTIQLASALPNLGRSGASNLSLAGPGADLITVHRNSAANFRLFTVATNTTVSVSGLTLAGGRMADGGAVSTTGSNFTLANCALTGNLAFGAAGAAGGQYGGDGSDGQGGGLFVASGTVTVQGTTFSTNQTLGGGGGNGTLEGGTGGDGSGGGIYVAGGTVSITSCTFSGDQATGGVGGTGTRSGAVGGYGGSGVGGGLYVAAGTVTVTSTTFANNLVTGANGGPGGAIDDGGDGGFGIGGGLYVGGNVSLSGCTLSGNRAVSGVGDPVMSDGTGGGIENDGGMLTLTNCTLSGNSAGGENNGYGGAINNDSGTLSLTGCTLVGNFADPSVSDYTLGGGVNVAGGTVTLTACTLTGNTAGDEGGGLENNGGTVTVNASTITGNAAPDVGGGGIFNELGTVRLFDTIVAGNSTDVAATVPVASTSSYNLIGTGGSGGLVNGTNHNLVGVANPGLGSLNAYGGPTQTIALLAGSPALGAGDPALLGTADQRGASRSGGIDIGAYQPSAASLVVSARNTVTAGNAFGVTVSAFDLFGQPAVGYTGTVTLSSTDPQASSLGSYTSTLADGGFFTFSAVSQFTAGPQTLTATDMNAAGITGSAALTITPAAAVQLLLSAPANVSVGEPFTLTVTALDAFGNQATGYLGTIHFDSTDPAGMLPADYSFQPTDGGSAAFTLTLNTSGPVRVTCTDAAGGLSGFLDLVVS